MERTIDQFSRTHRDALHDDTARGAIFRGTQSVNARRSAAFAELDDTLPGGIEALKQQGAAIKDHALAHLDHYLEQLTTNVEANGGQVHFAGDAADARAIVLDLLKRHDARSVVKSKSMVSEEIDLNDAMEQAGVRVVETDLGEFILQQDHEHPSHIVLPAIHKPKTEVEALFHRLYGTPMGSSADDLAQQARKVIRDDFLQADVGISGGNFLVAESGSVVLVENEGNARLTTSVPRVHIAIVGIEKLVPRIEDLGTLLRLLSRAATGQKTTVYVSLLSGPRRAGETDGPEHFHLVLVDNGRIGVLADPPMRAALRCIRCAACLNTCPVYQQIGGHAYGWVYSGPIGAVLDPALLSIKEAKSLPFASSLCGACGEVCPVKIPLPEMLVLQRRRAVEAGLSPMTEGAAIKAYAELMTHPGLYRAAGKAARLAPRKGKFLMHLPVPGLADWQREREFAAPSRRSFRDLWEAGLKDE